MSVRKLCFASLMLVLVVTALPRPSGAVPVSIQDLHEFAGAGYFQHWDCIELGDECGFAGASMPGEPCPYSGATDDICIHTQNSYDCVYNYGLFDECSGTHTVSCPPSTKLECQLTSGNLLVWQDRGAGTLDCGTYKTCLNP